MKKKPKRGDIILFKNSDLFGKLITFFTFGIYSHVAIYWGKGYILEISPLYMRVIPLKWKKSKDYHVGKIVDYIILPELFIEGRLKEIHEKIRNTKRYGWGNALFFAFLKIFRLYKFRPFFRFFEKDHTAPCNEIGANYLTSLGLKQKSWAYIPDSLISPGEFPKAFHIKVVK